MCACVCACSVGLACLFRLCVLRFVMFSVMGRCEHTWACVWACVCLCAFLSDCWGQSVIDYSTEIGEPNAHVFLVFT